MTPQTENLKDIIRGLRCTYFCKQEAFAAAIQRCKSEIALWESGRRRPSEESMDRIATALHLAGASESEVADLWAGWHREPPIDSWDSAISALPGDLPLYHRPTRRE